MAQVLFISPTTQEQEKIEELIQAHQKQDELKLSTTASFGQSPDFWLQSKIDVVVISLPDDDLIQVAFLAKIKSDLPKDRPIILITPQITESLLSLGESFDRLRVLQSPVEAFNLYRTILDLITPRLAEHKQAHPRYETNQEIILQSTFVGIQVDILGSLKNLSMGGAYVETLSNQSRQELLVGQEVNLVIDLPGYSRSEFLGKVVWRKPIEGGEGYGICFH